MNQCFFLERIGSPLGEMLLVADGDGQLCAADFGDYENRMRRLLARRFGRTSESREKALPDRIKAALAAYFDGDLAAIDTIPVRFGGTEFQAMVWSALRTVKPGRPSAYSALAARIGRPQSTRAVGHANGANPIGIVVPCHRLVGANGALTGYAGGLPRKRWLLDHEARYAVIRNTVS